MPQPSYFYKRIFSDLKAAFGSRGVDVMGALKLLAYDEMKDFVETFKPDVLIEMNRVKSELPIFDELKLPHIAWIVDLQGRHQYQLNGSDITYFFDAGWAEKYQTSGMQDWLPPAVNKKTLSGSVQPREFQSELTLIGHIPKPWSTKELRREIYPNLSFSALLSACLNAKDRLYDPQQTHWERYKLINHLLSQLTGEECVLTKDIYYDLMERQNRLLQRRKILGIALKKTTDLRIFGSRNWLLWKEFKKYYLGQEWNIERLHNIFQSSAINLHDGVGLHFRSIECLASGGRLFHMRNKKMSKGLHTVFERGVHYIEFDSQSFDNLYERYVDTNFMGSAEHLEVKRIIESGHTWEQRVDKILGDLRSI